MCFDSTTTSTSSTDPGPLTREAGTLGLARAKTINDAPYTPTPRTIAGFNPTQTDAFAKVSNFASTPSVLNERIIDDNGKLGAKSDYINPYIDMVLNPALRNIREQGAIQRRGIGDNAMSAGAYGDARHGVVEAQQYRDEARNIGDTTGQAYSDAWNAMMAARTGDRSAMAAGEQDYISRILAELGVGDRQQQNTQDTLDAAHEEQLKAKEDPYRKLDALLSFLTGNPTAQTVTQTQPNNSLEAALGAFAGGVL